jgi:hypothetical protein
VNKRRNSRPPESSRIVLVIVLFVLALVGRCSGVPLQDIVKVHRDIYGPRPEVPVK